MGGTQFYFQWLLTDDNPVCTCQGQPHPAHLRGQEEHAVGVVALETAYPVLPLAKLGNGPIQPH